MATLPPPQGMSGLDYEAIEAAVTETARGRWFLAEFARRNRSGELRQLLDAMGRLEGVISAGQSSLPPADPSIRLLMQRVKDVAGQLEMLSLDMREAGVNERFAAAVEKEARAVSGLLRGPSVPRPAPPVIAAPVQELPVREAPTPPGLPDRAHATPEVPSGDPRLAALADIDALSIGEKLALFA